jgi:hypothetical protein
MPNLQIQRGCKIYEKLLNNLNKLLIIKRIILFVHQKCKKKFIYSHGQKKVGQVLLINLAKIGLTIINK